MNVETDPAAGDERFPVFVDDTGRRRRWLRALGWLIGSIAAAYVALFAISLVGSPGLLPLSIPGVGRLLPSSGAPDIAGAGHGRQRPSDLVATPSPSPTPRPALTGGPGLGPAATPRPTRAAGPSPTASASPGQPTSRPSARPTVTPTARGSSSSHPSPRSTRKPTAHPTPTHTHGHGNRITSPPAGP